jgi:thiol-disulfide isomerase/thioredoxin
MRSLILFVLFAFTTAATASDIPPLQDTTGKIHRLGNTQSVTTTVVIFLNPDCPICQQYAPTLNDLAKGLPAGVEMYGVVAHESISRTAASKFFTDYKLNFPVLFDANLRLATALQPTHVPEAFVLNVQQEVMYRGRIDNLFAKPGQKRANVTEFDLKNAITEASAGKPISVKTTIPVGCVYEEAILLKIEKPNYNRHVSAILNTRCVACHRTGEVAPFPLTTFAEAKPKAKQIALSVSNGQMPPWKAKKGYGHFLDENHISKAELAILETWANAQTPEGTASDKPLSQPFPEGWVLGKPDMIIRMPEAYKLAASGPDLLRNFVIPLDLTQDKYVTAIQFKPGNRKVVHHAICFLDTSGQGRKLDAAEDGAGYSSAKGGIGLLPTGSLGGWAPGVIPRHVPEGMARYAARGSDLILQMHYHLSGKEEEDQSEIGVYFAKEAPKRYLAGFSVENWTIDMPAGEKEYKLKAEYKLPVATTFVGVAPHLHLLGKSMKAWAETPDGKTVPLVHISDWDFNWQDEYLYHRPFTLPKGTVVKMESVHDNSSSNPTNPNSPPKRITWGEGTADEMSLCIFETTCDTVMELLVLVADNARNNKVIERFMEPPNKKAKP